MSDIFDSAQARLIFAEAFLRDRVRGLIKDTEICLTDTINPATSKKTCAYFPAFLTTIALLDFAAGLYSGTFKSSPWQAANGYRARFLPKYDEAALCLIYVGFRHKVAHLTHPYIVFNTATKEKELGHLMKRRFVAWTFDEGRGEQAILIDRYLQKRQITSHQTPRPVYYDTRVTVYLRTLRDDFIESILGSWGYLEAIRSDPSLQCKFDECMKQYFPAYEDSMSP